MKYLIISVCLLFLSSCSTSINTIESNKDENYAKKSNRLFIVSYHDKDTLELMKRVTQSFSKWLNEEEIDHWIHYFEIDELELNSKFPRDEVVNYGPDALVLLLPRGGEYFNGDLTNLQLDISFVDPHAQEIVWRANLDSHASLGIGGFENKKGMDKLGRSIVDKMIEDDLLKIK